MTGLDIAQVRPLIESEIDRLIGILDLLEPDPDFEEGADHEEDFSDDEPWLGAPESRFRYGGGTEWSGLNSQGNDDREEDCEDEGAQCDDEGAIDCDLEPDHDNEEDERRLPAYLPASWSPVSGVQP
jgi:hypothetical protein